MPSSAKVRVNRTCSPAPLGSGGATAGNASKLAALWSSAVSVATRTS
ncbi:hypothetical protein L6R52_13825 [Myxococcota bacterium]|nr:hypothetical protein [Myxococcota bacterium]